MSDHRCGGGARSRLMAGAARSGGVARGLAVSMLVAAGVGGCSSSPAYPTRLGEQPGDGSVIAVQPRYPMSARDAAQDAADRASQAGGQPGYPAYGAAPAAPPQSAVYGPPPPASAPSPPADDASDDAPRPTPQSSVESSELPPPAPSAPPVAAPNGYPPAGQPQAISYGGGLIVFGTDSVGPAPLELATYHRRRHHAEPAAPPADAADTGQTAEPKAKARRRHGHAAASEASAAAIPAAAAVADTPYQTVVRPGEKLAQVAERVHSSPGALTALNDLKHPRRVKAGTVLKIPYRYSYEVQKGDTLYTIAHRFDQDPQAIAKLNGLKTVPTLQPGQSIDLPPTAEDTGKRDHAAAAAPSPVAAPEKLADAALRKLERHGRHRRGETPAVQAAAADGAAPTPAAAEETPRSRPARRSRQPTMLAAAEPPVAVAPTPAAAAEVRADVAAAAPHPTPRPYTPPAPGAAAGSTEPATTTYAGVRSAAPATGAVAGYSYRPAEPPVAPAASYRAAVAPAPSYRAPPSAPASRASAPAASSYAPTSTARAASDDTSRVASLTPPRYAPTYPAGGFAPSLGRERPAAPALSAGALTPTEIAAAGRGRFIWPIRGQLISGFGDKGTGQHNDGVDIAAISGSGVHAAAAGEVVYAGSSIPGFGNLVLVKHSGGWVTAYAHLDRIEVRMRDSVSQGEEIGLAGQTGAVDRPQLHFEVRYAPDPADKARPVDPALVLPAG